MSTRKAVIYHHSTCSKSRAALNLLLEYGVDVTVVNYIETPPSNVVLIKLLEQLGIEAKQLIRFSEPIARESGLSSDDIRDEKEWAAWMIRHPILIERPIVVVENKAVIGRPAETILPLLQAD